MNKFSISESVRFGWETFKKRPWFFIWTTFIFSLLSSLSFNYRDERNDQIEFTAWMIVGVVILTIVLAVISVLAKMAGSRFFLKAHEAPETVGFKESWKLAKFWRFFLATILKGLIIGLPAIVLMLVAFFSFPNWPIVIAVGALTLAWAVYAGTRLFFVELIVMDTDLTAVQSLKESQRITADEFWHLFGLGIVLGLVCLLGLLVLIVGILVALPVVMLAYVHVYKKLKAAQ